MSLGVSSGYPVSVVSKSKLGLDAHALTSCSLVPKIRFLVRMCVIAFGITFRLQRLYSSTLGAHNFSDNLWACFQFFHVNIVSFVNCSFTLSLYFFVSGVCSTLHSLRAIFILFVCFCEDSLSLSLNNDIQRTV